MCGQNYVFPLILVYVGMYHFIYQELFQFVHSLVQSILHTENSCHHHFLDLLLLFLCHLGESMYDSS